MLIFLFTKNGKESGRSNYYCTSFCAIIRYPRAVVGLPPDNGGTGNLSMSLQRILCCGNLKRNRHNRQFGQGAGFHAMLFSESEGYKCTGVHVVMY